MPDFDPRRLPFLTRKMLSFEEGAAFQLVIESFAVTNNNVAIRGATKEGPFAFNHAPTGDETVLRETFGLPDIPIWVTVTDPDGNYAQGDCYITLSISVNGDRLHTLMAGYISFYQSMSWPQVNIAPMLPFQGALVKIAGANPAAGAEIAFTIPNSEYWKVHAVKFTLVAAASAANRIVHLLFDAAGAGERQCISATAQIISQTRQYSCYPTNPGGSYADDNDIVIPIPNDLILGPGDIISTQTVGLQAGDDYATPYVVVERYFNPFP